MTGPVVARQAWSWSLVKRGALAAAACFLSGALVGYAVSHERVPAQGGPGSRAVTDELSFEEGGPPEIAFLAPVTTGTSLGTFTVTRIGALHDGVIPILCRARDGTVRLTVALGGPDAPRAAATAGRYAIYYRVDGPTPQEGEDVAIALARVLVADHAPPPGLGPLRE